MSVALPGAGTVTLERRQLYMLPTRHGLILALALAAMLLAAVNYHNGLAYLFTFLLTAMALVSMLYTHRNLVGIRLHVGACPPVFAGQSAAFEVWAHNLTAWFRPAVWIHTRNTAQRVDLQPNENGRLVVHIPTTHRGYLRQPPITVSTNFPLAVFYSWSKQLDLEHRCLVYPKPGPHRALPNSAHGDRPQWDGRRAEGDDFAGLREYRDGDPPRHVHWKTMARGQGMHTKRFAGQGGGMVWLEWEALPELDQERRLSQLCRWVVDAHAAGMVYGLRIPGLTIKPQHGDEHRQRCLRALALFGLDDV